MAMNTVQELIKKYDLQPHPEGGWYKETYKSTEMIPSNALPVRFSANRVFSTAIYFLLEAGNFSAFHRIKSDECWHFYTGDPLLVYVITADGAIEIIRLGGDFANGEFFQYVVPANCWFASRPAPKSSFSFVGCTVSPGFDFADFEMANAATLCKMYPGHKEIISELCR
jgi:uncharacterized protein